MKLTPRMLQGMYYALKFCAPFNEYRLPDPHKVTFTVTRSSMTCGEYDTDPHQIKVSKVANADLNAVLQTMAHEMVHFALERKGAKDHAHHDSEFNALAAQVCDEWGWNFKEF